MKGIGKKVLTLALTAALMMIVVALIALIFTDKIRLIGTISAVVVFTAALIFLAYKTSKSIT
jgi:uncharacterized membrane protein YqjE